MKKVLNNFLTGYSFVKTVSYSLSPATMSSRNACIVATTSEVLDHKEVYILGVNQVSCSGQKAGQWLLFPMNVERRLKKRKKKLGGPNLHRASLATPVYPKLHAMSWAEMV